MAAFSRRTQCDFEQMAEGNLSGGALADDLEDGVVLNVVGVVGLELSGDASERALESLLGGSVDHLGLRCVSSQ